MFRVTRDPCDPAGRRTARTGASGTTTYSYGPDGRLVATAEGATTTTSTYDAAGRLATVTVSDATPDTTRLVWDDSAVPALLQLSDTRGRTEVVAGVGLLGVTTPAGPSLVSTDHLGSALATPATSALVAAGAYGPFGQPAAARPEPTLGYRGELAVGALMHLRARDYDATAGAFTTRDPLDGVDGTSTVANAYHYADNDPLNRVDPTGMRSESGLTCNKAVTALTPSAGSGGLVAPATGSAGGGPVVVLPGGLRVGTGGGGGITCLKPAPGRTKVDPRLAAAAIVAAAAILASQWLPVINNPGGNG